MICFYSEKGYYLEVNSQQTSTISTIEINQFVSPVMLAMQFFQISTTLFRFQQQLIVCRLFQLHK